MTFGGGFGSIPGRRSRVKVSSFSKTSSLQLPIAVIHKVEEQRSGIAIVGRFTSWPWKQHPDEACLADALESLGLRVVRLDQEIYTHPVSSVECVVFTSHPASFGRLERWKQTHHTVVWATNLVPGFPEYDPVLEVARKASLFISADRFNWKTASDFDHHAYLPGACDPEDVEFLPRPEVPCAFIGSVCSERRRRIVSLVRNLGGRVFDKLSLRRYGQELSTLVQTVKIMIVDNFRSDIPGYWSAQNYTIPGGGGFLLTPRVPGLELDFALGQELDVYDSEGDLESKVVRWMNDDFQRESIRRAGYDRVRLEHTWKVRAESFLKILAQKIYKADEEKVQP